MDFLVERLACSHKRADVSSRWATLTKSVGVLEITTFYGICKHLMKKMQIYLHFRHIRSLQTNQKHFKGHFEKQPASAFRICPVVVVSGHICPAEAKIAQI